MRSIKQFLVIALYALLCVSSASNILIATRGCNPGSKVESAQGEVSTIPELGALTQTHGVWKRLGGRGHCHGHPLQHQ